MEEVRRGNVRPDFADRLEHPAKQQKAEDHQRIETNGVQTVPNNQRLPSKDCKSFFKDCYGIQGRRCLRHKHGWSAALLCSILPSVQHDQDHKRRSRTWFKGHQGQLYRL